MNIVSVISRLIDTNPCYQHILTNCVSSELSVDKLVIRMPDVPLLRADFEKQVGQLERDLRSLFGLSLDHSFSPFTLPFLPHPAQGGKHGNYLLFLLPAHDSFSYSIVRKNHLWAAVKESRRPELYDHGTIDHRLENTELSSLLERCFTGMYDHLKTTWTYLHPIVPYENCKTLLLQRLLFDDVLKRIESGSIQDIRRFVGVPCFTPIDYSNIVGGDNEH